MNTRSFDTENERTLEVILVIVTAGLAAVLYHTDSMRVVTLNLFYLPVILAAFFLGRYRAGILALLSVVVATLVITRDFTRFANATSPLVIGLAIMLWGAVLGLTAILVGSLCDERNAIITQSHEAQVSLIEVLVRYLQAADPHLEMRSRAIAQLCGQVARRMHLSTKEIDDIRIASLLIDIENIEIMVHAISKETGRPNTNNIRKSTFQGHDLVQSLGPVLPGAFPLLLDQAAEKDQERLSSQNPLGAPILHAVRDYFDQTSNPWNTDKPDPLAVLKQMQSHPDRNYHPAVLAALEEVLREQSLPFEEQLELAAAAD